jgi:hypothetical protein
LPPADDDVLNGILHDFVVGLTGLAPTLVFPRWQAQPPTFPPVTTNWAAIGVTSYEPVGNWPEMVHYVGYSVQKEHQLIETLATFYGPNSGAYASQFFAGLTVRQNLEVLGGFGIKLHVSGNIMHVPELINTQYVQRSDVAFRLIREIDRTYNIEDVVQSTVTFVDYDDGHTFVADVEPP